MYEPDVDIINVPQPHFELIPSASSKVALELVHRVYNLVARIPQMEAGLTDGADRM
jgi:hypothetical protein